VRIIYASVDRSAIIAHMEEAHMVTLDFEQIPRCGSTSCQTLSGTVSLRSATREWLGAYPGLRTLTGFEQSRVVHPGYLCVSASTRQTAQTTPAFKP